MSLGTHGESLVYGASSQRNGRQSAFLIIPQATFESPDKIWPAFKTNNQTNLTKAQAMAALFRGHAPRHYSWNILLPISGSINDIFFLPLPYHVRITPRDEAAPHTRKRNGKEKK
jgi:hypothetical protein